jgi:hypothetical protein
VKDDVADLIRELAVEHGVALERDDPILMLQTATRRILQHVLEDAQASQVEALANHRAELELATAKWHEDSKTTSAKFLQHVPTAIASSVGTELNKAALGALSRLEHALDRHENALARSTLACALATAMAVLAAAAFLWASVPAHEHRDNRDHVPVATEHFTHASLSSAQRRPSSAGGPRCE